MSKLLEKCKKYMTEAKEIIMEKDGSFVCPHCENKIKEKEIKIGKDKVLLHGKCKGKVRIPENINLDSMKGLFESAKTFIESKITDLIAKSIKNLDISKIGDLGQRKQPEEYKESTPLKDAKQRKHNKPFKPPKQNQ